MSLSSTTIRLDDDLRKELDIRLKATGLSLNAYFTLATKQFVIQNRVPFEIVAPEVPNETTRIAMVEAEAKELGIIPDDTPEFTDVEELKKYLNK
ncbi:type II toxin-antitoxin system RelB/DinJ family antitoxin [Companilactobacillus mishanensis]|uniref:Type II toxin-antitoxin system RelB/DinJ family antitoxin n=1 Tax=Companilactobacillus mishanensis TaxID=2486008 RepID=A0ABW9P6A0_9LACO|nr:type II toxin-antitoxin system RelB/DinJ family antitoxin [Companilactobacillus mishanensis]MQS44697.1 type II toxin-antitoxin system RelB/DinJ family antitoxin [Companilactobacillus mishanensis]